MVAYDEEQLKAAMESASQKSELGSNATDQLAPHGSVVVGRDANHPHEPSDDSSLETSYMGLSLRNPVVASAGPLSQSVDGIKSLVDGGVGAVVMYSLFEEQLRHEERASAEQMELQSNSFAEALDYFPTVASNDSGLSRTYLKLIEDASDIEVPLIASLNAYKDGDWAATAHRMEDAGAKGIELNIYYVPGDTDVTGAEVEERHVEILSHVKSEISIPVAVKISPYLSSVGHVAKRLVDAGADGLVLFNRFLQPDVNLERMEFVSGFNLSTPDEARLPRNWIANLRGRVGASLAATTGVETAADVVKYLLAGADVVMTTASLVRNGPDHAGTLVDGVASWLRRHELTLDAARGMLAVPADADLDEYNRDGYISGLERAKKVFARDFY